MKKKAFILFFSILITFPVFAQKTIKISGKVIDEKTTKPLSNVSIQIEGTLKGTLTDKDGLFELSHKEQDFILIVSYMGYNKKFIKIIGQKDPLNISLSPKAEVLREVVVKSSPFETVLKSKSAYVLDYGFFNDRIIAITFRNSLNNSQLILLDSEFDTLSKIDIPEKPTRLFKDCLGNHHVVCNKNIYQVFLDSTKLKFLAPVDLEKFENILFPCVAQDSANLYFETKIGSRKMVADGLNIKTHNHILNYYYVNKSDKKRNNLAYIEDEETLKMSRDEDSFCEQRAALGIRGPSRLTAEVIVFKEIFAPLYVLNNSVYVFDYINSKIVNYSEGKIVKEVEIKFHTENYWKREMCIDEKRDIAYAIYETSGITELKQVNLDNGKLNITYKLPLSFVGKVKVHDNYIYFLYHGKEQFDTTLLSRLRIE